MNVSRLKVRHKHFCTDAATRVSGSNCGQPSPVILISPYIYLCVCENYEVNNLFHVNSLQWNPRIAIVLVFPMETSRVQSPVSPNNYIIQKKKNPSNSNNIDLLLLGYQHTNYQTINPHIRIFNHWKFVCNEFKKDHAARNPSPPPLHSPPNKSELKHPCLTQLRTIPGKNLLKVEPRTKCHARTSLFIPLPPPHWI